MTAKTDEAIANTNVFIKTCTNVESVSTSLKFDKPTNFIGDNKSQSTKLKLNEKITGITINIRVPRTAGSININAVNPSFLLMFDWKLAIFILNYT